MLKLIKNIKVYTPDYIGVKDVLFTGNKIGAIEDEIKFDTNLEIEMFNGEGKILIPGLIDSHTHIQGGGGEGSYKTRTPEISLSDITSGGVTTIVGCLGTDGISRNLVGLIAKANALEEEGITTFVYTGSYRLPIVTVTGDVMKDIMTIDKVIGAGEIALSDHRSSQPTLDELLRLTSDVRVAGMLSGKAGVVNIHIGDSKRMLDLLWQIVNETEIPITQFIPTHMTRNPYIFEDGIKFAKAGGYIDFTTSTDPSYWADGEVKPSKAIKYCLENGVKDTQITFSSDGGGSLPAFNSKGQLTGLKVGSVTSVFNEIRDAVLHEKVPMEIALKPATINPASILKFHEKGRLILGRDADAVILDEKELIIDTVFAKGKVMVQDGEVKVFGTFEKI